jgi:hypothetical protein
MVTQWIAGSLIAVSYLSVLVPLSIVLEISLWSRILPHNPPSRLTIRRFRKTGLIKGAGN